MTLGSLNPDEREALETLAAHTTDAQLLRCALALLDEGETVAEVAVRRRVTRQTVYK
jgi:hypothetical protein